jgi:C_GCAxxG_C_C family probable redox protein
MTASNRNPGEGRSLVVAPMLTPADRAELAAASHYERGYWCGESVVKAVNDELGHPMPPDVFRLASGFCEGLGGSRCICGALAGGVMATGLVTGRSTPDHEWEPSYDAARELRRRWAEDQCAESCEDVVSRIGGMHLPERWAHCTMLVGRTARWVMEIVSECEPSRGVQETSPPCDSRRATG